MDNLLSDEFGKTCYVYVDDILIFGRSEKEHDDAYKRITEILERNKLLTNEEKTLFKQKEVAFLGHFICENRIRPNINKLQAINDIEPPKNKRSLQQFLGMINYYRRFIKNCSIIGGPLYELLKIKNEYKWTDVEQDAFKRLKNTLKEFISLKQPDFKKPFVLETDASNYGISAILSQEEDDELIPIAFASRRLLEHEIKHSV